MNGLAKNILDHIPLTVGSFVLVFGIVAVATQRITFGVQYRPAVALSVQQIPGQDLSDRLVLVDLGDRHRAIRTGDRLLRVEAGGPVCLAERRVFLRAWTYYSLALPTYCRGYPTLDAAPFPT